MKKAIILVLGVVLCAAVGLWVAGYAKTAIQKREYYSFKTDLPKEVNTLVAALSDADGKMLNDRIVASIAQMSKIETDYAAAKAANAAPEALTALVQAYADAITASSSAAKELSAKAKPSMDKIQGTLRSMATNSPDQMQADQQDIGKILQPAIAALQPSRDAARAAAPVTMRLLMALSAHQQAGEALTADLVKQEVLKACQAALDDRAEELNVKPTQPPTQPQLQPQPQPQTHP